MTRMLTMVVSIACTVMLGASCHEKCEDPIVLYYRPELHDYLKSYKLGSWWVYVSTIGVRDSVYVSDYSEYTDKQESKNGTCYELPEVYYFLNTSSMDQVGHLYARYLCGAEGYGTSWDLAPTSTGPSTFGCSYYTAEGYAHASILDTNVGGVQYLQALMVRAGTSSEVRDLQSLCLAKDIGIVGFITTTDTFTISNYSIP